MIDSSPNVTIAVLNYNGKRKLERFLPGVFNIAYPNQQIIVVDGGSTDGSLDFLAMFPKIRTINQGDTTGVAHAMNVAAKKAEGELILFLGNDMWPHPESLSLLVRTLNSDQKIAVCGPKVMAILEDGSFSDIIDHVGFEVDRYGFPKPRGFGERDRGQYDSLNTSWFFGSTEMLIRKEVIATVGYFDDSYITLSEDIDFCWRVHEHGYEIALEPKAVIHHDMPLEHTTLTNRWSRGRLRYFAERNTQRTVIKNYATRTLARIIPEYMALLVAEMGLFALIRRIDMLEADIRALLESILNFGEIWQLHGLVQSNRVIPDERIVCTMSRRSYKFEILKTVLGHLKRPTLAKSG